MLRRFLLLTLLAAAGCAARADEPAPPAAPAEPCFYAEDVTGFRASSARVIYIATGGGLTVRAETYGDCREALSAQTLAVRTHGAARVCRAGDADLFVSDGLSRRRCPIQRLHVLTAAEAAALPRRDQP